MTRLSDKRGAWMLMTWRYKELRHWPISLSQYSSSNTRGITRARSKLNPSAWEKGNWVWPRARDRDVACSVWQKSDMKVTHVGVAINRHLSVSTANIGGETPTVLVAEGWPSLRRDLNWYSARNTWWRHHIETLSALLALCEGNPPVTIGTDSPH